MKTDISRLLILAALLFHINGIAAAQTDTSRQDSIVFTPQWTPQSQFAGYYVAKEMGFYEEAGLHVDIVNCSTSNPALNKLKEKKSDIITMQLPQAMEEMADGCRLVNILQTSQHSSLVLVSRKPIKDFKQLNTMRVGKWKVGFSHLAEAFARQNALDIEWIPFIQNINLFISGAIDATLATSFNEYYQLLASGVEMNKGNVIRFSEIDYDVPEDGVYVTEEFYRTRKEVAERFAKASARGWEWTAAHRKEALEIVMKYVSMQGNSTNRVLQKWMLEEILVLQKNGGDKAEFRLSREGLERTNRLLVNSGLITRPISYEEITGQNLKKHSK